MGLLCSEFVCARVCVCIIWLSWSVISIHSLAYVYTKIHDYIRSYSAYGKALNVIICYINKYQFYNHNLWKCVTVPRCLCALLLLCCMALSFCFFYCIYLVCVYMVARLVTQDTNTYAHTQSYVWVALDGSSSSVAPHDHIVSEARQQIKECFEMILINIKTMHFCFPFS